VNDDFIEPESSHTKENSKPAGKDEMNLAEFPLAKLGRNDTKQTIQYEGWVVDRDGVRKQQKWIVSSTAAVGLPTEFAERVLVSLIAMTAQDDFKSPKVAFTVYRILKMLGLSMNKRNYKAVEKALKQLVGVTLFSEGAFWNKQKQKRVTTLKGFHLINDIWLKYLEDDTDVIEDEGVNGYIVWGEEIWNSFKAGYIKNLDIQFYYSLESALARRLYRFLDKRMHYQNEYQIDVFDLASRLGMTRYRYPSKVREKLKPGFDELIKRGYLASVEPIKIGRFTRIKFVKAGSQPPTQIHLLDEPLEAPGSVLETIAHGVAASEPADAWRTLYDHYDTSPDLKVVWQQIVKEFADVLPTTTLQTMVTHTALLAINGETAVIGLADGRAKEWLENRMSRAIKTKLSLYTSGKVSSISFISLEDLL
jgi:hypothetical protein